MNINDITITKEEIKQLKEIEDELNRAYRYSYKRQTTTKQNEMVATILKKYGIKVSCNHCPQSVFEAYKQLGRIYFNSIEKHKEEEITAELTTPILIPDEVKENTLIDENQSKMVDSKKATTKRGRPRSKK